jgi:hypothetical protein
MECSGVTAKLRGRRSVARLRRKLASALLLGFLVAGSALAETAEMAETKIAGSAYEPTEAGHPLRIAAYVLHPVGVILDRLILRPAAWLGRHEPIKTLVGNTD